MFRSKTNEFTLPKDLGDWEPMVSYPSFHEINALGKRLDSTREALARSEPDSWAHSHWTSVARGFETKWKRLMVELQIGIRRHAIERAPYEVRMDWWEPDYAGVGGISLPWLDDWFESSRRQEGLERSWAKAKLEELQKARQGLN